MGALEHLSCEAPGRSRDLLIFRRDPEGSPEATKRAQATEPRVEILDPSLEVPRALCLGSHVSVGIFAG